MGVRMQSLLKEASEERVCSNALSKTVGAVEISFSEGGVVAVDFKMSKTLLHWSLWSTAVLAAR